MRVGCSQYDALELVGHEVRHGHIEATFSLEEPSRERLYTLRALLGAEGDWWGLEALECNGEVLSYADSSAEEARLARWFDAQDHTTTVDKLLAKRLDYFAAVQAEAYP